MVVLISLDNFKCEDCGGDKFTMYDKEDRTDITLFCASKDCEASYTFSPTIKLSSSSHPPKLCSCGRGFLSDKYCSMCGKKNPLYWNLKSTKKKIK